MYCHSAARGHETEGEWRISCLVTRSMPSASDSQFPSVLRVTVVALHASDCRRSDRFRQPCKTNHFVFGSRAEKRRNNPPVHICLA